MPIPIQGIIIYKCYKISANCDKKCLFRCNWLKIRDFYIILPSDKSATPHFHQFGELTAEKRFLFAWKLIKKNFD